MLFSIPFLSSKWLRRQRVLIPLFLVGGVGIALLSQRPNPYAFSMPELSSQATRLEPVERELAFYEKRLQHQPDGLTRAALASAYFKMAQATRQTHWYLKADRTAQQSLNILSHDNPEAILIRARVAEAKHDFDTAITLAKQVLEDSPNQENALSVLVTSYLGQGRIAEADSIAKQLVQKTPTAVSYTLRALVDVEMGEGEKATAHFQAALAAEETGELASAEKLRMSWGQFLTSRGQLKQARSLFESARQISPQSPQVLVALAHLDTRERRYQDAAERYAQVFQSQSAAHTLDHEAAAGRAALYQLQGQPRKAQDWWAEAEHSMRDHGDLETFGHQRELAQLLLTRGNASDLSEALSLMEQEARHRQDHETLDTYAWALSQQNRQAEALEILQIAMKKGAKVPLIYFRAAAIARSLNQSELAHQYQKMARSLDSTIPQDLLMLWGAT